MKMTEQEIESARQAAREWRKANPGHEAGLVVVWAGEVAGWTADPGRAPDAWVPGCLGIENDGTVWLASGGNPRDGAKEWSLVLDGLDADFSIEEGMGP